jgi:rhomboid protease GluP
MNSDYVVQETLLSSKPKRDSSYAGLASVAIILIASIIYWENWQGFAQLLPASGELVFQQKQYWRLLTAILVHSDIMHFLANAIPLALFSSLLYGYFGPTIFPALMIPLGCLIHLITLLTYPPQVTLVGASGVVYCMAGFWLTLYVLIERRFSIGKRLVRSIGFALIVFVPSVFDPSVSYRAHIIGFVLGTLSATIYFRKNRTAIRQVEVVQFDDETEEPPLVN